MAGYLLPTSGTDQIEHTVVGLMFHADFVLHKHCLSAGDKYDVWVLIFLIIKLMMIVMMTMMKIHGLAENRRGVANAPLLFLLQSLSIKQYEADDDDNEDNAKRDGKGLSTYFVSRQRGGRGSGKC